MKKQIVPVGNTLPTTDIYQRALSAVLARSKSSNTVSTYNQGIGAFQRNGGQIPTQPMYVAQFLETATTENGSLYSIASLQTQLASISAAHRSLGFADPTDDPLVRETLKALKKERGTKQKQARPLLLNELVKMCQTNTRNHMQDVRDHAMLLVGWVCALRRSELCAIQFEHLTRQPEGYKLFIPSSKTDQTGEGWFLPIPKARKLGVCPVDALEKWFKLLKQNGINSGYVFRQIKKGGAVTQQNKGLTGVALNSIVQSRATLARIKTQQALDGSNEVGFSGHSMRAGFITEGAKNALPDWMLQATSRHSSIEMLRRYIRAARLFEDSAARKML